MSAPNETKTHKVWNQILKKSPGRQRNRKVTETKPERHPEPNQQTGDF
jgi:hypothetical protein